MSRFVSFLAVLALTLGLAACACSSKPEGSCPMCASGCKSEGKEMKCEKDPSCSCCAKGAADGRPAEGHQH